MNGPPDRVPLFPLPNVVLFPKAILPLHIFEPRYRIMMDEVLKGDQTICVALLKPGWEADYYGSPEVFDIACVGRIVQHRRLDDGRYNLTLHGERKVRIEGTDQEKPYRIARVRTVSEDASWARAEGVQADVAELLSLFRRVYQSQGAAIDLAQIFGAHMSPEAIVNTIAMHVNVEPRGKQELLRLDVLEKRSNAVLRYLRDAAAKQDLVDRVRHLYPSDQRQN